MFRTGPPEPHAGSGLRVGRAARRVFAGSSALATDPAMRRYVTDMAAPYGLAVRDDVFAAAAGHSYGEMAEPLVDAVVGPDSPVDVLALAHAVHDVRFGRNTATYLSGRCAGEPLAFAVCEQGAATPFTALRALHAYAATGACRRALLIVAEQSALHYELAEPAPVADRHVAVALVLEPSGDTGDVTTRQRAGVDAADVRALLATELRDLRDTTGDDATVIVGPDVDVDAAGPGVGRVVRAAAGAPCTAVWWELAGLTERHDGEHVVLAEHDARLGILAVAALRVGTPVGADVGAAAQGTGDV